MSQSSDNQADNYELHARTGPNQTETSRRGEICQLPATVPSIEGPNQSVVPALLSPCNLEDSVVAARADAAYQDGLATYFSIPPDKEETRLALPGDQLILPRIDVGTSDSNFTPGYTAVYAKAFSYGMRLPFSNFVNNLLITINRAPDEADGIYGPRKLFPRAPCPPTSLPAPVKNPVLKRVAENIPASLSQPSKKMKRSALKNKVASKVLAHDSREGTVRSQGSAFHMGPTAPQINPPAATVDLTSSATFSDPESLTILKRNFAKGRAKRSCFMGIQTSSQLSKERAKRVDDLNKELSTEKEAAKAWAAERATLLAKRDDSRGRYIELERTRAADITRVQFDSQKIREFLVSPNYAYKVNSECAAYFHSIAFDHKDRFPDLVTLFGEEKMNKPDWYDDLSLSEEDIPLMRKRLKARSSLLLLLKTRSLPPTRRNLLSILSLSCNRMLTF
ncbi:hypothetical protein LIER_03185 [Lithospermum erythrorhizon]|uniref:Uncharacterized protein n=1 Tax=Lithospermum erythrorhizon TaxID=34254 RepID=A0AAV3NS79_LITER